MVSYAKRTRFFSRNSSTGKVLLDVHQIGAAFAEQRGVRERLREWKADRISKAVSGEGLVELKGSRMLVHFIPAATLMVDGQSLPRIFDNRLWGTSRTLVSLSPEFTRYNADGFLLISKEVSNEGRSYLQVFKDGKLEYGDSYALGSDSREPIRIGLLEQKLVDTFQQALSLLRALDVSTPLYVTVTLLGVKGAKLATRIQSNWYGSDSEPIDRDVIVCPDMVVPNFSEERPYSTTLLPIVNSIWQAAGIPQSLSVIEGRWQIA